MQKKHIIEWARNCLCGVFIGAGAILPGVSGGVLAVVFGIYKPFIEIITYPKKAVPKYWSMIPPLAIGWCFGFWGFAKGIAAAINFSTTVTTWLFIGLIIGTIPALFQEAGKEGHSITAWISLILCALTMFSTLFYVAHILHFTATPNFFWYNFCGALWGASFLIPGLTSSSIMMALGLYEPMLNSFAKMDLIAFIGCLPGFIFAVLLLSRFITWFLKNHYDLAFHGILGIVLASTFAIIPLHYVDMREIIISFFSCVFGFLLAFFMEHIDRKWANQTKLSN